MLDVLVISLDVVLMVVEIISTTSTDDQSNTGLRCGAPLEREPVHDM